MAQAPPLTLIFPGKTSAPIRKTGRDSEWLTSCRYDAPAPGGRLLATITLSSAQTATIV
jgi:hypothetical protein